jgi:folate-dependent phosphoribosylglycinamide formyltransferase PurN
MEILGWVFFAERDSEMMSSAQPPLNRPIRVIMFGSGPVLTPDAGRFLCRLEAHPDIVFLEAFCQAESQSFSAIVKDLWRRRGLLAAPLLVAWFLGRAGRFLSGPRAEIALQKQLAQMSDRIHFVKDIHSADVIEQVRTLAPDLGLVYGSPILKPALFDLPVYGSLGIHHGEVPKYRGNKTAFWAMYNGESQAGVTIQKINAGLDTGYIVKAGAVPIGRRSLRAVWHDLEELGLNLYIQAILEMKDGKATFRPQEGPKGKLYKNPKLRDYFIFWGRQVKRRFRRTGTGE